MKAAYVVLERVKCIDVAACQRYGLLSLLDSFTLSSPSLIWIFQGRNCIDRLVTEWLWIMS